MTEGFISVETMESHCIVESALIKLGLGRTEDRKACFIKWTELKPVTTAFKEGIQLVNHIDHSSCLTSKNGLLQTLRDYERFTHKTSTTLRNTPFNVNDFFMQSYKLDVASEREEFFATFKEGEMWICKPSGRNQGKGIFLVTDAQQLREKLDQEKTCVSLRSRTERIIQRYITNPLLMNGRKFDIRVFMLISSVKPLVAFYHPGYLRLSCLPYSNYSTDLTVHLTNQYVQKKNPLYKEKRDETVVSFESFNQYLNTNTTTENDWFIHQFKEIVKRIMVTCLLASKDKLDKRAGMFDLLGFDFMIDQNMKVWLIEINTNPALHTTCTVLQDTLPALVEQTLEIVIGMFDNNNKIPPLKDYELLFNSKTGYQFKPAK